MDTGIIKLFRQDLDQYSDSDIKSLARLYQFPLADIYDLKWMIAIKHGTGTVKAHMPPTTTTAKAKDLEIKMIFVSGNYDGSDTSNPELELVKKLIKDHSDFTIAGVDYLGKIDEVKTVPGKFKAYVLVDDKLAGVASGAYQNTMFDQVTRFGMLNESEIKWVQIANQFRGRGLCTIFVKYIVDQLSRLYGATNVVVDNVGGVAGCKCYSHAAEQLGWKSMNVPANYGNFIEWIQVDCDRSDEITHLFDTKDFVYSDWKAKTQ